MGSYGGVSSEKIDVNLVALTSHRNPHTIPGIDDRD